MKAFLLFAKPLASPSATMSGVKPDPHRRRSISWWVGLCARHRLLASLLVLNLSLLASGCSDSSAAATASDHEETACTYKAGHGVQLTPAAREFADLTTDEVAPRGEAWTAIPRAAVLPTANGPVVYVANGDWFLRTPIELGAALDDDQVEVTAGLYEGDLVAVGGLRVLTLAEIQAVNGGVGCADGH